MTTNTYSPAITPNMELTQDEAAFLEARRNSLLQKGGDPSLVARAKIPDGCGKRTKTMILTSRAEYTIPAGADGAVFCPTYPLNGGAAAAQMNAAYKYGGLTSIPTTASAWTNASFQFDAFDDMTSFLSNTVITHGVASVAMPWRPIGFNIVGNTSDSKETAQGVLVGGQLPYHPLQVGANSGGWFAGNASGAGAAADYPTMYSELIDFNTPEYSASDGITVRTLFNNDSNRFSSSAKLPNRYATVYGGFDGDYNAAHNDTNAGDGIPWTGRGVFPVVVLRNAAAGATWTFKVSLIIEVDCMDLLVTLGSPPTLSPYSARLPYLMTLCNDVKLYPQTTTGHSLWPTIKARVSKGGKMAWRLIGPAAKAGLVEGLSAALV